MSSPFLSCLLDLRKHLSNLVGVCDVKLITHLPVERSSLTEWETKYHCLLPDDFKTFLLTSDGFQMSWFSKCGDIKTQVGKLQFNSISNMTQLSGHADLSGDTISFFDLDISDDDDEDSIKSLTPSVCRSDCRLFEIESLENCAHVCLVYRNCKVGVTACDPQIWLLDRSFQFHFIADNFNQYYRLALMNLGLPHWQFLYTDLGLPPLSKQWYNLYSPLRFVITSDKTALKMVNDSENLQNTVFDVAKVLKSKNDKKKTSLTGTSSAGNQKPNPAINTRKQPVSLLRSSTSTSVSSTTKSNSANSVKK